MTEANRKGALTVLDETQTEHECADPDCKEEIPAARYALGYLTCLRCGDRQAKQVKHLIAIPYSKGAYQYIHNPKDLFQTNPKEVRT
jgi:ribosomal protein L37AE/L43A